MEYDFSQFIRDSDGKVRSNRKLNNNNYGKMGDETWYDYLQNNKESMIQSDYAPVNEGNADFGFVARNDNGYAPLSRKDKLKNYDAALSSVKHKLEGKDSVQVEEAIESNPEEFVDSESPEIAKEAQQIVNNDDKRDDEVNNANIEKALRKTIPGSEPDPLGVNISNEERANWNGGKDRAVGDATLSEMDNALASRTRPVKPGTEMLSRAQPKGLLGAGMLYSRDNNIPKPSEERPILPIRSIKPTKDEVEQTIEENPEAVKDSVPEDNPIHKEAEQVTDGDERTTEANDEKVEEGLEQGGIDWTRLEREAEEAHNAPRPEMKDEFGNEIPDFVSNDETLDDAVDEAVDEVFDPGLEDLNQYSDAPVTDEDIEAADQTVYDETMAEQPVISEDRLAPTEEVPYADNVVQIKDDDLDEAVDEAIAENVPSAEEPEKSGKFPNIFGGTSKAVGSLPSVGSSMSSTEPIKMPGSSFGIRSSVSSPFMPQVSSSGSISAPSVSVKPVKPETVKTAHSHAGGGTAKIEPAKQGSSSFPVGGSKSSGNVISNGASYSGGTNKSSRSLKYVPSSKMLPKGEERMEEYVDSSASGSAGNEAAISNIEARVKSIQPWSLAEQLGFSSKYKNVAYNGTSIDALSPEQIREVEKILDILGV